LLPLFGSAVILPFDIEGRGRDRLRLADDDVVASTDTSPMSWVRLVRGLFNLRSGCGAGSISDGDAVADLRFLLAGVELDWISLAFSKAFQARISSPDSGSEVFRL